MKQQPKIQVIVVGGGAAGMMAAYAAARQGAEVLLLERGAALGRKLLVTGKGRCNITNATEVEILLQNVVAGSRFLHSAFARFDAMDTMSFFEQAGLSVKIERGNRVFPISDRAIDVRNAMQRQLLQAGVIVQQARVTKLLVRENAIYGVECEDARQLLAPQVIVATGGLSYPKTGSTGDGYHLARQAGHTIEPLFPSLVPMVIAQSFCGELAGLSLKNVRLDLYQSDNHHLVFSKQGEMLFTHFGISGPLVLSASAMMGRDSNKKYRIELDLKPALSEQTLDDRILREFATQPNKIFANSLQHLLPKALIGVMINLSGIPPEKKIHDITRQERMQLVKLLKQWQMDVLGLRPIEEAVITAGGIRLRELSPKTMESKLVKGLFFAGEVLNADGYTGGFNLQIAFSTGFVAGTSVAVP